VGSGLSQQVHGLIADRISSVVQLEVLLLLHGHPDQPWTADEVAAQLRIDPTWAEAQLAELATHGLVQRADPAAVNAYRYTPASDDLRRTVDELSKAYADRRVAVISLIYSKPSDTLKTFADAFRIRKEKDRSDG
jgi:predicted ArsR family transcriptional regulator